MVAVIFDMDGVIVDSEQYWEENSEAVLADAVESEDISFSDVQGMNVGDQYDHLAENFTVSITKEEYVDRYDEKAEEVYTENVELLPGFEEMTASLLEDGVPIALTSSSYRDWIQMVLDRFELADIFQVVVSVEDIDGRSKPAPDIYIYTAERLGADPEECVVVEDSSHGVTAAKEAGMWCVGFRTELNQEQDLSRADIVVGGAAELRRFFADGRYRDLVGRP